MNPLHPRVMRMGRELDRMTGEMTRGQAAVRLEIELQLCCEFRHGEFHQSQESGVADPRFEPGSLRAESKCKPGASLIETAQAVAALCLAAIAAGAQAA